MITEQQKNFQKIQLNPNAIQQNLITLTESNEQENSNPSTLFEKIEIIVESLTVHINLYDKLRVSLQNDCKKYDEKIKL